MFSSSSPINGALKPSVSPGDSNVRTPNLDRLAGPWLLFDNEADPFQTNNLAGSVELDTLLRKKLRQQHNEFLSARSYISK